MSKETAAVFQERIEEVDLPPRIRSLVQLYDERIGIRDNFVWRWMYSLLPSFRLSCVGERYDAVVREQKTILTMFITVLDDIAEYNGDQRTFEQARNIPFPSQSVDVARKGVDEQSITVAQRLWDAFENPLTSAPRYEEFLEPLRFDIRRTLAAMDYSRLLAEQPAVGNIEEAYECTGHNMVMFPYADVDLMHSPRFERDELGSLRSTVMELQQLARIGNWITTWEREITDGDYSSGVVIEAFTTGVVDCKELQGAPQGMQSAKMIDRIKDAEIEERFQAEWRRRFDAIRATAPSCDSVDLAALITGMEDVFDYHQQSKGAK